MLASGIGAGERGGMEGWMRKRYFSTWLAYFLVEQNYSDTSEPIDEVALFSVRGLFVNGWCRRGG